MAIKTINGILKEDSTKTIEEFNTQIKTTCDNAELVDTNNDYVGLVFNLKDKRIDFVPSSSIETAYSVSTTTIVDGTGGSSDDEYNRSTAMPTTVGGAITGTTFSGTVADALDKVLYPFVKPTFSSFTMSNQSTSLEVGESINGTNRTFIWSTTKPENITPNTIKITSGGVTILDNASNDGSETFNLGADIVKTTNTTHFFYINGIDTQGNSFNRVFSVYWKWKFYYGSSPLTVLSETDVKTLSSILYTTRSYTYSTPANNYKWICYPSTFGLATKFEDTSTGFGVAMESPLTISVTNGFGVATDYLCYRTTNSMAGSVNIKVS